MDHGAGHTGDKEKQQQQEQQHPPCKGCQQNHDLDDCPEFKDLAYKDKKTFLFRKRLCFSCYKTVSPTHTSQLCTNKRKCNVCDELHPTGLHVYPKDHNTKGIVNAATGCELKSHEEGKEINKAISLCIVPVNLRHNLNPDNIITVYAMLDNCSEGTFVTEEVAETLFTPVSSMPEEVAEELATSMKPTSIGLKTINGMSTHYTSSAEGLQVSSMMDLDGEPSRYFDLPKSYTRELLPIERINIPTVNKINQWEYLRPILHEIPQIDHDIPIGLLIGGECSKMIEPNKVIPSSKDGPYAFRTVLGWCISGSLHVEDINNTDALLCNRIAVEDISTGKMADHHFTVQEKINDHQIHDQLVQMYQTEFVENLKESKALSVEDKKFLDIMEHGAQKEGKHHKLPLPLRNKEIELPNNRSMALKRVQPLKRRFQRDPHFHKEYTKFMNNLLEKGAAKESSTEGPTNDLAWFIPHHGVLNKNKPGKVRPVFDCGAKYMDESLNKQLLPGPDLTNLLVGVQLRFRQEEVPVMADIESMFYQVRVADHHRRLLKFLWWPNGDYTKDLREYEMCVHVFGAISSGSCANYALRKTADENEAEFGSAAASTLRSNFYVDDMLKSIPNSRDAIQLIRNVTSMCEAGGFNLTKFVSTDKEVLNSLPSFKLAPNLREYDLSKGSAIVERALGTQWCIESDELQFRIEFKDSPLTRKGMLSTISSIYDPPGLASPFILEGRKILQSIVHEKRSWDDEISEVHRMHWERWRSKLVMLEKLRIPRCVKPAGFGEVVSTTFHHFSDASEIGYGTASYIRQLNANGKINVSLLMGKSRVTPMRPTTIPRLELNAAGVATKISNLLNTELNISPMQNEFWSDSKIVLGYITNEVKRFKIYVANRAQKIQESTDTSKWNYVPTTDNPADYASRGLDIDASEVDTWFNGPTFLRTPEESWSSMKEHYPVEDDDPEVKKVLNVNAVSVNEKIIDENLFCRLEKRISGWFRCIRVLATIRRFIALCKQKVKNRREGSAAESKITEHLNVEDLQKSEDCLIRMIQNKYFKGELQLLNSIKKEDGRVGEKKRKATLKKSSSLRKLDPFVDKDGIIRVGGRLRNSTLDVSMKHPVILPRKCKLTIAVVRWIHQKVEHSGRNMTLNELRVEGYWVINGNSIIRSLISKCVRCRYLRGRTGEQKMADLPQERMSESPPFTYSGVDMFGPFIIKERRSEVKRYVALFTCLSSRAIHLETTISMETDSFINALRRFVGRRGDVRSIRSDNGGNFIGAENELKKALSELDHEKIRGFLQTEGADWIEWERNPPAASHMGGVWERQIRSVRSILSSLMKTHGHVLNDESLRTLMVEAEAIVNSRPLTVDSLSDPDSLNPLSPTNILTLKSKVTRGPPGVFQKADLYCRKRWRRVQHISNEFWLRWRREFLLSLQNREKWTDEKRNFAKGDIVLVKDEDVRRNQWPMARVVDAHPADDGMVRSVKVQLSSKDGGKGSVLERPIAKLVLLLESEES